MATGATQVAAETSKRTPNDRRMYGYLREIRAACQYLQVFLAGTLKRAAAMEVDPRKVFLTKELGATMRTRVGQIIEPQLQAIRGVFDTDVTEFEWCAADITRVDLIWSRVKDLWPTGGEEFVQLEQQIKQIGIELDSIVYECVSLTMSPTVNDLMGNLRIGQPLDIDFIFDKEFPNDPALRQRLLEELAQEPQALDCGVVDVAQGVIYKIAASRKGQRKSIWHIVGLLVFGLLILMAAPLGSQWIQGLPDNLSNRKLLLVDYGLILLGSGAHLAVEALRAKKNNSRPNFQALNDWLLWVHVRESQIVKGLLYIWAGYALLVFFVPGLTPIAAFFGGYSIDSVTELFLERFQTVSKLETDALSALVK
jgi:hypothetical protein